MFFLSHGAYNALFLPLMTNVLSKQDMKAFWLVPAETPWIGKLLFGFNMLSLAEAGSFAICIGSLYWLKPWESRQIIMISSIWLIIGLLVISYGFIYPQLCLARVVRAARLRQIQTIQSALQPYLGRLGSLSDEERKLVSSLIEIHDRMLSAKQNVLDVKTVGTYLTSLVLPTASFVLGRLGLLLRLR